MTMGVVWMNGQLVQDSEAMVPFLTAGLHYGMGVFEGIRCYETARGPAVFRLREHLRRLAESAHIIGLELKWSEADLVKAHCEVVTANGFRECYLRPLVFATTGGWN